MKRFGADYVCEQLGGTIQVLIDHFIQQRMVRETAIDWHFIYLICCFYYQCVPNVLIYIDTEVTNPNNLPNCTYCVRNCTYMYSMYYITHTSQAYIIIDISLHTVNTCHHATYVKCLHLRRLHACIQSYTYSHIYSHIHIQPYTYSHIHTYLYFVS